MSIRLLDLPDALRDQGVEPVLVAGWQTRGGDFAAWPRLHLRHWTAGSRIGVTPSLHIVTFGRADLPYNLCQTLQSREGGTKPDKAYVVSAGMAQHAGTGRWGGVDRANSHGTGNEIDWSGPAEAFPANRIETSVRIAAAFQSLHPDPQGKFCCEHREYATPAGRKQDTNLDGYVFRRDVDAHLHGGTPQPPPRPLEVIDMAAEPRIFITSPSTTSWFLYDGFRKRALAYGENQTMLDMSLVEIATVKEISDEQLSAIPDA